MAEPAIDWEALTHALARTLERPTESTYQGAPYTSRDPGTYRYRSGEVEPDVGLLDPVDLLAGLLSLPTRNAVKALARRLASGRAMPGRRGTDVGSPPRDFAAEAARKIGQQRAEQEAASEAYLARLQKEIDAAFEEHWRQYRSPFAQGSPAEEARRLTQYEDRLEARVQPYRSSTPAAPDPEARRVVDLDAPTPSKPSGGSADYADVIRRLFEQGGQ